MEKSTEQPSRHENLEELDIRTLLEAINAEDQLVPLAVSHAMLQIETFVEAALARMEQGGRLFYIGAGTSGRLGIVDASECPPTYGVPAELVVGVIAGGDTAIRTAVEGAEDDTEQGWEDLLARGISAKDVVVGLSASGTTPYVVAAVQDAGRVGVLTGCITCNRSSPLAAAVDCPIEVVVGPEFVTGSTRMKAGTAQKLVLNMLSTTLMIKLGRVKGNLMVDMQLSNAKLIERGTRYVQLATSLPEAEARALLLLHGSVRAAVSAWEAATQG